MGRESRNLQLEEEAAIKPAWLETLISETFFTICGAHEYERKNEKNVFCLDCCKSVCPHCFPSHPSHPLLQVRRYVYHDVVRLDDLEKLIDCSHIQPYTINSAKVIFLKQRNQTRSTKSPTNMCTTCERILQEPFRFCSLSCKVDRMVGEGEAVVSMLRSFDRSELRFDGYEEEEMEETMGVEECNAQTTKVPSFCCSSDGMQESMAVVAGKKKMKKKKKKEEEEDDEEDEGGGVVGGGRRSSMNSSFGNRRKGHPRRSPFC